MRSFSSLSFGLLAKAGFADPKGSAGQRNADALPRRRSSGHRAALRWPVYFFPRASLSNSFCMLSSANIFLSRRFSSSIYFIWLTIEASIPPNFARNL